MEIKKYIVLENLEVYQLSRTLSALAWEVYVGLDWDTKKIIGHQFIESTDSVGANIAEGYFRFHYLDKIRFYYNSRGSLGECWHHWVSLLYERGKIDKVTLESYEKIAQEISVKLNNLISATYRTKQK